MRAKNAGKFRLNVATNDFPRECGFDIVNKEGVAGRKRRPEAAKRQ